MSTLICFTRLRMIKSYKFIQIFGFFFVIFFALTRIKVSRLNVITNVPSLILFVNLNVFKVSERRRQ